MSLTTQLEEITISNEQLGRKIGVLKVENNDLKAEVDTLKVENTELRTRLKVN